MKRFIYSNFLLSVVFATLLFSKETVSSPNLQTFAVESASQLSADSTQETMFSPSPGSTSSPSLEPASQVSSSSGGDLNSAVNKYRQENSKTALSVDGTICSWANQRADEISRNFSHEGFDNGDPLARLGAKSAAENIAMTSKGANYIVFEMWVKSPGHKENVLGDYTRGCGVQKGRYAVYIFARP